MSTESVVRAEDIARRWDLHPNTVRRWAKEGRIPSIRLGGGPRPTVRFDPTEVERALKSLGGAGA